MSKTQTLFYHFVGVPGFEPGTPCSQSRCANRTALHPEIDNQQSVFEKTAERGGFEPPVPIAQYVSLANWWIKPLSHLSVAITKVVKNIYAPNNPAFFFTKKTVVFFIAKIINDLEIIFFFEKRDCFQDKHIYLNTFFGLDLCDDPIFLLVFY